MLNREFEPPGRSNAMEVVEGRPISPEYSLEGELTKEFLRRLVNARSSGPSCEPFDRLSETKLGVQVLDDYIKTGR